MRPPSTKVAPPRSTTAPISRAVAGATALPSTKRPVKRWAATSRARSSAAWGGQMESTTSLVAITAATVPASSSPAAAARPRVSALRPAEAQSTRCPAALARQVGEAARRRARRQIGRAVNGLDLDLAHEIAQQDRDEPEHGQQRREHDGGEQPEEEALHAPGGAAHHAHEERADDPARQQHEEPETLVVSHGGNGTADRGPCPGRPSGRVSLRARALPAPPVFGGRFGRGAQPPSERSQRAGALAEISAGSSTGVTSASAMRNIARMKKVTRIPRPIDARFIRG